MGNEMKFLFRIAAATGCILGLAAWCDAIDKMPVKDQSVVDIKMFSCPALPGISFQYPVFKGWPVKTTESSRSGHCVIWLDWPDDIDFEAPPRIDVVRSLNEPVLLGRKSPQNPQGIIYAPSMKPKSGAHEVNFYTGRDAIRIQLQASGPGFSPDLFWDRVIETFRVENVSSSSGGGDAVESR